MSTRRQRAEQARTIVTQAREAADAAESNTAVPSMDRYTDAKTVALVFDADEPSERARQWQREFAFMHALEDVGLVLVDSPSDITWSGSGRSYAFAFESTRQDRQIARIARELRQLHDID